MTNTHVHFGLYRWCLAAALLILAGCFSPQDMPRVADPQTPPTALLDGTWLNTTYFDSIFAQRRIAPNALQDINLGQMLIRIKGREIETEGMIFGPDPWLKPVVQDPDHPDTYLTGDYEVTYRAGQDLLLLRLRKQQYMGEENEVVTYRRLRNESWRDILAEPVLQREKRIAQVMRDSILVGTYRALSAPHIGKTLVLDENWHLHGHKRFTHYSFETGFGLIHPYCGRDGIMLYDSLGLTIPEVPPGPPIGKSAHFGWEFKGDTLVLTLYATDNWETYYPTATTYRYLRVAPSD